MVGIGGEFRLANAPVWCAGNDAFVKVPKFSVIFVTLLVGDHGTDAPSALMAVNGGGEEVGAEAVRFERRCSGKQLFTS